MDTETALIDPVLQFINDSDGMDPSDDFLIHMITLTDVVKNDMKKTLNWDEVVINNRLHKLIETGLDVNYRYRINTSEKNAGAGKMFPLRYTEAQCLLTEWLGLYRTIRIYITMRQKMRVA